MTPKDIIERVHGLTREQLTYYAKMGYVKPRKYSRGKNEYNEFSEKDFLVIEKAFHYINNFGTTPKIAFGRARKELKQPELKFK